MSNDNAKPNTTLGLPGGTKVGKYEVIEKVACGGQAIVYKCSDPILNRLVAIKQISSHLAGDRKFIDYFRKEAQILARLGANQPAILTLYDVIEDERGLFIVTEFVEGHTLETILNDSNGPVDPKAALQVIWRLAAGLHAVHTAGIIHRDIKPGNIIIGDSLRVKITDFGVAASLTGQTSMIMGTTKYMSPEIFEGGKIDGRSDMYSLGMIAYEMLAGRPKFNEVFNEIVRDKHSEPLRWMKWHGDSSQKAPPLSEVNPLVPQPLSDIVASMMAKNLSERMESMEALGKAIKTSFSSAARAAAAPAATPAAASTAARANGPLRPAASPSMAADEADTLELAGGPATAPLPKKGMSRRSKIAIIATTAAMLMILGVTAIVFTVQKAERRQQAMDAILTTGITKYQEGVKKGDKKSFIEAMESFKKLSQLPNEVQGAKATVLAPLTAAQIAVLDRNWSQASDSQQQADQQIARLQAERRELDEWTRTIRSQLGDFKTYQTNTRIFVEAMELASDALAANRFEQARTLLNEKFKTIEAPTQDMQNQAASLNKRIDLAELKFNFIQALARAEKAASAGKFDNMTAAYGAAKDMLKNGRQLLSTEDSAQLQSRLQASQQTSQIEQTYHVSIAAADAAKEKDDLQGELDALQAASKAKPSAALNERLRKVQASLAFRKGRQLMGDGDFAGAKLAFQDAVKLDPSSDEAKKALAEVDHAAEFVSLVQQGKSAVDAGNLADGLDKLTRAYKLREDPQLLTEMNDIRYRLQLAEADQLRAARKYTQAGAALEKARQIKPEAASDVDTLQKDLQTQQQYEELLVLGDKSMQSKQYSKAMEAYGQARQLRPNGEVEAKIKLLHYTQNIANGNESMESRQYKTALAYYKAAQRFIDNKEVQDLISQADEKVKASQQ